MWHASVHRQGQGPIVYTNNLMTAALRALHGVGDPQLGEWHEHAPGSRTFHVKRRVLDSELANELRDLRGTDEGRARAAIVRSLNPARVHHMIGDW